MSRAYVFAVVWLATAGLQYLSGQYSWSGLFAAFSCACYCMANGYQAQRIKALEADNAKIREAVNDFVASRVRR